MMLDAPFPWFGGKRRVADVVWRAFGDVQNYIEPFFGSGAVLLGRPRPFGGVETVNDLDGLVANFWRSIKHSPDETARWADNPVNENDLHARHIWLLGELPTLARRLEADPDWHDPKVAGWWAWGISCWIGGEFCSGKGPWQVLDGQLVNLGDGGRGVNRTRVHLGHSQGVVRKLVHLGDGGRGVNRTPVSLDDWFAALSERLSLVRVASGDWSRVCGSVVTLIRGSTAVFLDPPYADTAGRDPNIYRQESTTVAHDVRQWAIEVGTRPDIKIALCGYEGEHDMPENWRVHEWRARGDTVIMPRTTKTDIASGSGFRRHVIGSTSIVRCSIGAMGSKRMDDSVDITPTAHRLAKSPVKLLDRAQDEQGRVSRPYRAIDFLEDWQEHGDVTSEQKQAADDFRIAFHRAQHNTLGTLDVSRPMVSGRLHQYVPFRVEAARWKVWAAVKSVGGLHSFGGRCLWHVIGLDISLRQWVNDEVLAGRRISMYRAKILLIRALDDLRRHFGL